MSSRSLPQQLPQFYWLWAPINFPNLSLYFHVNEDGGGRCVEYALRACHGRGSDHDGLLHLSRPKMDVTWRDGQPPERSPAPLLHVEDGEVPRT